MIRELSLRNKVYKDCFRFEVSPDLWYSLYVSMKEGKAKNIIRVVRNGVLKGYAVYSIFVRNSFRAFGIMDICVDGKDTLEELINRIIERSRKEGADFIYLRNPVDPYDCVFDTKGFLSFRESIIMVALLDPRQLLSCLSEEINSGSVLRLIIKGFNPISVKVGRNGVAVIEDAKPNLTVVTDSRTFIRLFFGRTSFLKEFLMGKIKVNRILQLKIVIHFFSVIKQKKWYIPFGDWS